MVLLSAFQTVHIVGVIGHGVNQVTLGNAVRVLLESSGSYVLSLGNYN